MSGRAGRRPLLRWSLLVLPLLVAGAVLSVRWPELRPQRRPDPVDVTTVGPAFATLDELVAASDLIVVGTIDAESPGRAVTDPADPTAGIRTTLYALRVEEVLAGGEAATITIEHETALLDGTPITIDGVPPPRPGERGLYFLVAGTGPDFPHHAIVGSQGRYPIDGTRTTSLTSGPLGRAIDGSPVEDVEARIAGFDRPGG